MPIKEEAPTAREAITIILMMSLRSISAAIRNIFQYNVFQIKLPTSYMNFRYILSRFKII